MLRPTREFEPEPSTGEYIMDLGLKGKKAIITGGKRGLGFATAHLLAEEGCDVAICARGEVDEAVAALAATGVKAYGAGIDAADGEAYKAWLAGAVEQLGGCDIFVHNMSAASGRGEQAWVNNLNLDVLGLVRAQEVLAPAMEAGGGGAIVCLSSIAAQEEFAGPGSFGPMKAAMTAYANNLAQSLAPKGIRVNIVSPGPVFFEGGNWDTIKTHMTAFYDATVAKMPLKRLGDPREIANAIAFLASPAASLITGANLVIDGGYTKRIKF
jgi:NAD(P)-dependent dehydrogenase (short-subunit alcohol dehydrogenase family)